MAQKLHQATESIKLRFFAVRFTPTIIDNRLFIA